jgi:hypothetical protein
MQFLILELGLSSLISLRSKLHNNRQRIIWRRKPWKCNRYPRWATIGAVPTHGIDVESDCALSLLKMEVGAFKLTLLISRTDPVVLVELKRAGPGFRLTEPPRELV